MNARTLLRLSPLLVIAVSQVGFAQSGVHLGNSGDDNQASETSGENVVSTPSIAETEGTTGRREELAREFFQRGSDAYDAGRFEEALTAFDRSYELSGRSELHFDLGLSHDRLREDDDALEHYRAYLDAFPNSENRVDVLARIERIEAVERIQGRLRPERVAAMSNTDALGLHPPRKSRLGLVVGLAAGVLAVAAGVALFLWGTNRGTASDFGDSTAALRF